MPRNKFFAAKRANFFLRMRKNVMLLNASFRTKFVFAVIAGLVFFAAHFANKSFYGVAANITVMKPTVLCA